MTISKPGFFGPLPFTADQLITHSNKSNTSFPPSNISPPVNRLVTLTDPGTDSNIASPSSGSFSLALTLFLTLSHSCAHIPTPTLIRACTLLHACTTAHTHTVLTPRDRCCKVSKKGYWPRTTPTPPKKNSSWNIRSLWIIYLPRNLESNREPHPLVFLPCLPLKPPAIIARVLMAIPIACPRCLWVRRHSHPNQAGLAVPWRFPHPLRPP